MTAGWKLDNLAEGDYIEAFAQVAGRKPAWHEMGTPVDGDATALEATEAIGALYNVDIVPLTPQGYPNLTSEFAVVRPKVEGLYESDAIISTVKGNYTTIQNRDFVAAVGQLDRHLKIDAAGTLGNGAVLFVTWDTDGFDIISNGKKDENAGFIYAINSHKKGLSPVIGAGALRIVCVNTAVWAVNNAQLLIPVPHRDGGEEIVKWVTERISAIISRQKALQQAMQAMANTPLTEAQAEVVINDTWRMRRKPKLVRGMEALEGGDIFDEALAEAQANIDAAEGDLVAEARATSIRNWENELERMKQARKATQIALWNMVENQGLGLNAYTVAQAAIEYAQHRNSRADAGAKAWNSLQGDTSKQIGRAIKLLDPAEGKEKVYARITALQANKA